jgi:hypothetical protein
MEEPVVRKEQTTTEQKVVDGNQVVQKDQVVTNQSTVKDEYVKSPRAYMIIWYILGLFEILLAFRLVLQLLSANAGSGFVYVIYGITDVLVAPFRFIFPSSSAIFQPSTIVAMIVYAILVWGIAKLIDVIRNRKHTT